MIDFIEFIQKRIKNKLPGLTSHKKMSPVVDESFFRTFKPKHDAKDSAVLLPLIINNQEIDILFTLRSKNISHSGQISFPGGRCEQGESKEETALRETFEEIGIPSNKINIIGKLSYLYVPPSNSIITPVIGNLSNIDNLKLNFNEVTEVFTVPFKDFIGKKNLKEEFWDFNGVKVKVPFWNVHHSTPLWGATAMMLSELLDIYQEYKISR